MYHRTFLSLGYISSSSNIAIHFELLLFESWHLWCLWCLSTDVTDSHRKCRNCWWNWGRKNSGCNHVSMRRIKSCGVPMWMYCTILIDSLAPVTCDMADQIFGSLSAAVTCYMGEIFIFVNFIISQDGRIVAYGEACVWHMTWLTKFLVCCQGLWHITQWKFHLVKCPCDTWQTNQSKWYSNITKIVKLKHDLM